MIAMALLCEPDLLIADEPTTALDVTVQAQILELIQDRQKELGLGVILITHDLGVIAKMADRVAVMYAGRIVEEGPVDAIFADPRHPYTIGLKSSIPRLDGGRGASLRPIPGMPPRCPSSLPAALFTRAAPTPSPAAKRPTPKSERSPAKARATSCAATWRIWASPGPHRGGLMTAEPLLEVRDLKVHFAVRRGLLQRTVGTVKAVDGISFDVAGGTTLGLVGESGCGKSTTGRALLRLVEPTSGSVRLGGKDLVKLGDRDLRRERRRMQMIFQDPYASLNPRMTILDTVAEPLGIHGLVKSSRERLARVAQLLETVGLEPAYMRRYPHEFSGGQRQRIGIARALALSPELIVADEPVSALDVSIQAQIVNLLDQLQKDLGLTYLFIAHDLAVVRHLSREIAVMYLGRIVERATTEELFARPAHPYTQALLSAIPIPDPKIERKRKRLILTGDVPSPLNPPSGCHFHTRCPYVMDRCHTEEPVLRARGEGHVAACHLDEVPAIDVPGEA